MRSIVGDVIEIPVTAGHRLCNICEEEMSEWFEIISIPGMSIDGDREEVKKILARAFTMQLCVKCQYKMLQPFMAEDIFKDMVAMKGPGQEEGSGTDEKG